MNNTINFKMYYLTFLVCKKNVSSAHYRILFSRLNKTTIISTNNFKMHFSKTFKSSIIHVFTFQYINYVYFSILFYFYFCKYFYSKSIYGTFIFLKIIFTYLYISLYAYQLNIFVLWFFFKILYLLIKLSNNLRYIFSDDTKLMGVKIVPVNFDYNF